ncbi:MAG TPA: DUF1343 domain-containing protein, partial [Candidatus Marinimicrobia bacterium]|nr:DUF1343 domain-containing protein [Candidatus Neomarinimicrobiota bacterium]
MKYFTVMILMSFFISACGPAKSESQPQTVVKTGIEVLQTRKFDILKGKKVGLITNQTAINSNFESAIDLLYQCKDLELVALYAPEHGVRGDYTAGEKVGNYKDEATGVQVYSLYGKYRKPNAEMLKNVELLVFDIQDIGSRSYTYISTMGVCMEAAAEHKIPFVVLDRPNPLGGKRIEGNIAEEGFFSFVSQFAIPYVHGLTVGELAQLLNGEALLNGGVSCELTVVPMEGWHRDMSFEDTGLPWVLSSPHIPHAYSAAYYTATGVLGELGVISEGVGYTLPFQVLAAPWIDAFTITKEMNALNLPGVTFRPIIFKPYYGKYQGQKMQGVQIHIQDYTKAPLLPIQFHFMEVHHRLYPDKDIFEMSLNRHSMFDKVNGSSKIREIFSKSYK